MNELLKHIIKTKPDNKIDDTTMPQQNDNKIQKPPQLSELPVITNITQTLVTTHLEGIHFYHQRQQ